MTIPVQFLDSLETIPGFNRESFLEIHGSGKQVTSVRLNPLKLHRDLAILDGATGVPWCSHGYYLPDRPSFTLDPLFHAGCYYVQEASSMFLEYALSKTVDLSRTLKVLDLCAAPGGKSTLIQSLISANSLLVSNEVIRARTAVLRENITKWGAANVVVTGNDAKDFSSLEGFFDVMVVDAPCSGSGLFRKDPEAITEWSSANVQLCSQRQQRILADAIPSLKENGVLIYSTCSFSKEEDEDIVAWLLNECGFELIEIEPNPAWNIITTTGYRFYPYNLEGEGFFLACLRKRSASGSTRQKFSKEKKHLPHAFLTKWLKQDVDISFLEHEGDWLAMPYSVMNDIPILKKHLYIRQAGILIGKTAGKDLIPDHALAMSKLLHEKIASISLNYETALQYLRKDEVLIESGEKGWNLVQFQGENLGWIKVLPGRVNNYYPKEWRIFKR